MLITRNVPEVCLWINRRALIRSGRIRRNQIRRPGLTYAVITLFAYLSDGRKGGCRSRRTFAVIPYTRQAQQLKVLLLKRFDVFPRPLG